MLCLLIPCGDRKLRHRVAYGGISGRLQGSGYLTAGSSELRSEEAKKKRENWRTSDEMGNIIWSSPLLWTARGACIVHGAPVYLAVNELIQPIPAPTFAISGHISKIPPQAGGPILVCHIKTMSIRKQDVVRHFQNLRLYSRFNIVLIPRKQPHCA